MNTLSRKNLLENLSSWSFLHDDIKKLVSQNSLDVFREGIHGVFAASFITLFCKEKMRLGKCPCVLVVVPGEYEAKNLAADFSTVFPEAEVSVFPSWEAVPYRPSAARSAVFGKRAAVLSKLALQKPETAHICIVTERVILSPLPPPEYSASLSLKIVKGKTLDVVKTAENLAKLGYIRVPRVTVCGEFSLRGEVLDIFPPGSELAVRVIFDFDEIEQIKFFDPIPQTATGATESVTIPAMKEVVWDDDTISRLSEKIDEYKKESQKLKEKSENTEFEENQTDSESDSDFSENSEGFGRQRVRLPFTREAEKKYEQMLEDLMEKGECEGEELFYPILWKKSRTESFSLVDYLPEGATIFCTEYARLENGALVISREFHGMYRKARIEMPVFPPDMMLLPLEETLKNAQSCIKFNTMRSIDNGQLTIDNRQSTIDNRQSTIDNDTIEKNTQSAEPIVGSELSVKNYPVETSHSFFGNINYLKETLSQNQNEGWQVYIFADGENQALRIRTLLKEFCEPESAVIPLEILPFAISGGFSIADIKLQVIQENEIFGRKQRKIPKSLSRVKSQAIDTFIELNPGDYVVHVNYGIGKFLGIERVKAAGHERDYIKLEYAGEEFAFVPIEQVNMVQRYIGSAGEHPKLDHIGSKNWENRKNKTRQAVEELAAKLIDLYSRRAMTPGIPYPKDTEWQMAFEASFPYEDTPDQAAVTEEIKADMEKPVPMDRLVCGDVGYGKTELAMRAAFKAIMGGRQVAFMAPTTILAEQHYETCVERFANFPVKIALMSRFVTPKEIKKTKEAVAKGEVDLLVGTHRIIQKDIVFKNLGLMIIDEEQRFGVKDKERLKEMRTNIDCLCLSATPIPRTLHMGLLKIRDMSVLATPPQNRQPIETEVAPYDDEKVAMAIRREVERGGQVFFLHNRVESLLETKLKLERLVPEMMIDMANGQMPGEELDNIFRRFKMGGFHVLVATTIVENGIDIPNVNTIIIDRADMYGVSQLYQLRGRVGRSDRKAYAYLFYPKNSELSEVAMKRLQVISDFTELGSGFKIAMKDMEIRGAGNLLGRDQSGEVYAVGFDMYMRLLNEAIDKLMHSSEYKEQSEVLMELEYTGFIPADYIENTQTKMEIYKKIAAVQKESELLAIQSEMEDRFGPVPDEVLSLLSLAEIRILCSKLSIASLKERKGIVQVEFAKVSDISVDKILRLIKSSAGTVTLNAEKPNTIFLNVGKIGLKEKSEYIREKLEML